MDIKSKCSSVDKEHAALVKRIAYHLKNTLPSFVQADDLIQDGYIGLLEAIRNYDPAQGASFETYAGIRIRGAMLDGMRKGGPPRSTPRFLRAFEHAENEVERVKLAPATKCEVASQLGISVEDLMLQIAAANTTSSEYFDFLPEHAGCDGDGCSRSVHFRDPADILDLEQHCMFLDRALHMLSDIERVVFMFHTVDELDLHEIGEMLGFTESRACQIYQGALAELRALAEMMANAKLSREAAAIP